MLNTTFLTNNSFIFLLDATQEIRLRQVLLIRRFLDLKKKIIEWDSRKKTRSSKKDWIGLN